MSINAERILAQVAAIVYDPTGSYGTRGYRVRELLATAGVHAGQVDDAGRHVTPPHDDGCPQCIGEAGAR